MKLLKTMVLISFLAFSSISFAEGLGVSVTGSIMPGGEKYSDSLQLKLRAGQKEGIYLQAGIAEKEKVMETQPIGKTSILSYGVGYRKSISDKWRVWAEVGATETSTSLTDFAIREDIYHGLVLLYGEQQRQPPFLGDKTWGELDYAYRTRPSMMGEVGISYKLSNNFEIEASYYILNIREHYGIWNPDWNGGPGEGGLHAPNRIECGCFWEGHKYNQLGGVKVGFTVGF